MRDRRSTARRPLATLLAEYGLFRIAHSGSRDTLAVSGHRLEQRWWTGAIGVRGQL